MTLPLSPKAGSRSRPIGIAAALVLGGTACQQAIPAEEPGQPAPVRVEAAPPSEPSGTPWASEAPPSMLPEMRRVPVAMTPGERCKTFRRMPALRFTSNTLVRDACLKIPDGAVIEIRQGTTLAIVATNGLMLGSEVTFDGRGVTGRRGARGSFASVRFGASTDSEIRQLCVDQGNRCACPTDATSLASIRGQQGERGTDGASVHLLVGELIAPTRLAGFEVDVSGGDGGAPGESGTRECARGNLGCSSSPCATGVSFGAAGVAGTITLALGTNPPAGSMARIRSAVTPPEAAKGVLGEPVGAALLDRANALTEQALREGWQQRSGEDAY